MPTGLLCPLAAGLVLLLAAGTAAAQEDPQDLVALQIEPLICHLGSLSPVDPLDSESALGKTAVRVLSVESWMLAIAMTAPVRRLSDGLELPPLDPSESIDPIPANLFSLEPCVVATGQGSGQWQELEIDWRQIANAFERGLVPMTPPGTYGTTLAARLMDSGGEPLTEAIDITIQFEAFGWIRISETVSGIDLSFAEGEWDVLNETGATAVLVGGNLPWQLRSARVGELVSEEGLTGLPVAGLAVYIPGDELPPGLQAVSTGYVPIGIDPITIVTGDPENSSSESLEEIPIVVRLESDDPLPAGRYRMTLVFEASANEPLP